MGCLSAAHGSVTVCFELLIIETRNKQFYVTLILDSLSK